jgi:hypothetical protein
MRKQFVSLVALSALALAGCSGGTFSPGTPVKPAAEWSEFAIDPQTEPETVTGCKALDIGKEVYALMGQTTLIPRINKANNLMCAFVVDGTEMTDAELKEAGLSTEGEGRAYPDLLLITVNYRDSGSSFDTLYPEVRPDGKPWGQSDLGDRARWWSKDPMTNGEHGNLLGVVSGDSFMQIGTSFPDETPLLNQPQSLYEDIGRKILDGPHIKVDPRL